MLSKQIHQKKQKDILSKDTNIFVETQRHKKKRRPIKFNVILVHETFLTP